MEGMGWGMGYGQGDPDALALRALQIDLEPVFFVRSATSFENRGFSDPMCREADALILLEIPIGQTL